MGENVACERDKELKKIKKITVIRNACEIFKEKNIKGKEGLFDFHRRVNICVAEEQY